MIAKSLAQDPSIVIFDEPTRGVDVGTIPEIHAEIRRLAEEGKAVVVISSYLPEVLAVSDRILVARLGRIVAEFDARPRPRTRSCTLPSIDRLAERDTSAGRGHMTTATTTASGKAPLLRSSPKLSQEQVVGVITLLLLGVFALALPGFATTQNFSGFCAASRFSASWVWEWG